ncbi:SPW repeat protein [Rhabdobacter roseus]
MLDYLSGVLFIASPWLFGFNDGGAAQWLPMVVGFSILLMSLFTEYELGVMKSIKMTTHLNTDLIVGLFLAASPWLFGFAEVVYLPHLVFGLIEAGAGLVTKREPSYHPNRI